MGDGGPNNPNSFTFLFLGLVYVQAQSFTGHSEDVFTIRTYGFYTKILDPKTQSYLTRITIVCFKYCICYLTFLIATFDLTLR